MNTADQLTGTPVLVHPELHHDPAGRRGEIGMITEAQLAADDIFVSFGGQGQSLFSSDALLVLKKPNEIYRTLMVQGADLGYERFKKLYQVNLLQQYGNPDSLRKALEMAASEPELLALSLEPLQAQLRQSREVER